MEDEPLALPGSVSLPETGQSVGASSGQPGAQAMEALVWAIAQEFVVAFDEFNDAVLSEDEPGEPLKVHAAGK